MRVLFALLTLLSCALLLENSVPSSCGVELELSLRHQTETAPGTGRYHQLRKTAYWMPGETAVIVCDVWDLHHSQNAVRRVEELGPRLNEFVKTARALGMTIIHAPSDCMEAYADHPARRSAQQAEKAKNLPDDIKSWCSKLPVEEGIVYPVDQSDGGADDDPAEQAAWAEKLKQLGRNPATPWKKQSALIEIDATKDYISDRGDEIWNVLEQRGIENVILTGVHTNMCVLGRPFGLRQMVRNGKKAVLARDLTDTMYNPASWPYVSHFTGTDLIISHIERHICPTISSVQLLGGKPLRFKEDTRPHLVMLIAEDEYETNRTLPEFAAKYLGQQYQVSFVYDDHKNIHDLPGLEILDEADALLVSVRRRPLPAAQLGRIVKFVSTGKPVIGLRTASHAFAARGGNTSQEYLQWPEFDAQVFGGNYHGHYGNQLKSTVSVEEKNAQHPILAQVKVKELLPGGSLYKTAPLSQGTTLLLSASVAEQAPQPAAWTYDRADGGRSFYTSLGHQADFENLEFARLLYNAICWATQTPVSEAPFQAAKKRDYQDHWGRVRMPGPLPEVSQASLASSNSGEPASTVVWYRCAIRLEDSWLKPDALSLKLSKASLQTEAWVNGVKLLPSGESKTQQAATLLIPSSQLVANDANLLVLRVSLGKGQELWPTAPVVTSDVGQLSLSGWWQFRWGTDPAWNQIPLPARYGMGADVVFDAGQLD